MAPPNHQRDGQEDHDDEDSVSDHDQRLSSTVARGFKEMGKQIAEFKGETRSEMNTLSNQFNELKAQLGPIFSAFQFGKDNINERLIRLEEQVKTLNADVTGAKTRAVGLAIAAVTALAGAAWSLIQSHIALKP